MNDSTVFVRTALPPGGLDELLERPMTPLVNLARRLPDEPSRFPFEGTVMAPNSRAFLASLGRPLALAEDLESRPGVWWLGTTDGAHQWVIFSDCHRKSSWKGGQVCALTDTTPTADRPNALMAGVRTLQDALAHVWGQPEGPMPSFIEWDGWFTRRAGEQALQWPRDPSSQPPKKGRVSRP